MNLWSFWGLLNWCSLIYLLYFDIYIFVMCDYVSMFALFCQCRSFPVFGLLNFLSCGWIIFWKNTLFLWESSITLKDCRFPYKRQWFVCSVRHQCVSTIPHTAAVFLMHGFGRMLSREKSLARTILFNVLVQSFCVLFITLFASPLCICLTEDFWFLWRCVPTFYTTQF